MTRPKPATRVSSGSRDLGPARTLVRENIAALPVAPGDNVMSSRPEEVVLHIYSGEELVWQPGAAMLLPKLWYEGFASTDGLTLNGDAAVVSTVDGDVLRLADAQTDVRGSAFTDVTTDVSMFSTHFQFRITDPGGIPDIDGDVGADGITFTIQPIDPLQLGNLGVGIGYEGIGSSVAVEFDTWNDDAAAFPNAKDPDSNYLGIDINGSVESLVTVPITPDFDDGNLWYAWVDYNGTDLEVRVNQTGVRPAWPTLTTTIDIPGIVGADEAYVGFTAATGGAFGNHDIVDWHYDPEPMRREVNVDARFGLWELCEGVDSRFQVPRRGLGW